MAEMNNRTTKQRAAKLRIELRQSTDKLSVLQQCTTLALSILDQNECSEFEVRISSGTSFEISIYYLPADDNSLLYAIAVLGSCFEQLTNRYGKSILSRTESLHDSSGNALAIRK